MIILQNLYLLYLIIIILFPLFKNLKQFRIIKIIPMNQNFIQHCYGVHSEVKQLVGCSSTKKDHFQVYHLESQSNSKMDFNKNLKNSKIAFQRKSMLNLGSESRVPTFILNRTKGNGKQQLPLAGLGHMIEEDPFINEKMSAIESAHRNQHKSKNGQIYKSQIYIANPEKVNNSIVTAEKKYPKMPIKQNRDKRLQTYCSVKTLKIFNNVNNQADVTGKDFEKNSIEDRRATVSSVNSNSSIQQHKNNKKLEVSYQLQNHIPIFIKKKEKNLGTHLFTITPKHQTQKKNHQFWKKKHLRNMSLDGYDSFQDKISLESRRDVQISDFEMCEKLGKGAYGDVFLAKEVHIGFYCVIKKISKKKIREQNLQESILREIKIQAYADHKHLEPIYGVFDDENYVYIILEYMVDGTLAYEIKKQRRMSQSLVAYYLKQLCQAVCYMHNENIIHRDIKPDNIFLHHNYLKLGDMGCSVQTQTLRSTIVGCLAYVSPEQLGKQFYDEKIDIWSIGILTYEMLFGKSPFEKQLMSMANENMQMKVLPDLEFPIDYQISQQARDLIESLLKKDPESRPHIRQVLKHPFLTKHHFQQNSQSQQAAIKMYQILNK